MGKRPLRLWRYEVTAVDGFPDGAPVVVGDVIIDVWKANRCWQVFNFTASPSYVGSWMGELRGEVAADDPAFDAALRKMRSGRVEAGA